MSGHSKWSTIKRKKEKTDAQRAKLFTKMGREMAVAVREGGADPNVNGKLRDLIAKAKSLNVPNDNIDRAIKKAGTDREDYEQITYEGYGPNGVAVIVDCLTDNRNRTAGDLRHYFDKWGGNLGQTGSVGFLFNQKGMVALEGAALDEDAAMELCIECGGSDYVQEEEALLVYTEPGELAAVRAALEEKGYKQVSAELTYVPTTYTRIEDPDVAAKMERLLDMLEDNDDVQDVWHNWES